VKKCPALHDRRMRDNKFKVQTSAGGVMATVFWETAAIFLEEFLKSGTTIIG
jgi:hypothetical protein